MRSSDCSILCESSIEFCDLGSPVHDASSTLAFSRPTAADSQPTLQQHLAGHILSIFLNLHVYHITIDHKRPKQIPSAVLHSLPHITDGAILQISPELPLDAPGRDFSSGD